MIDSVLHAMGQPAEDKWMNNNDTSLSRSTFKLLLFLLIFGKYHKNPKLNLSSTKVASGPVVVSGV